MTSDSQEAKQHSLPIPPRFRWLRNGTAAFVVLFLVLVGLRVYWGLEAQVRLAEIHRAASARGEPFLPEDFRQPSVPDAENAAVPIQEAIKQTDRMGRSDDRQLDKWDNTPPVESDLPKMEAIVAKYRPEMQLVHTARSLPQTSWESIPTFPGDLPHLTHLSANRKLARVLILSAKLKRAQRLDGLAIEAVEDELVLTEASDTTYPTVLTHLVAIGVSDLGTNFICTSSMSLAISERSVPGATPDQVRALIGALLDERKLTSAAVRDFQGERAIVIDSIPKFVSLTGSAQWMMLEPMYQMDGVRIAQLRTAEAEGCRQTNWVTARSKLKHRHRYTGSNLEELAHRMSLVLEEPMDRAVQYHFRALTERRAAAIMLALRLYQIDHQGALPESLSQLVPKYLPAIPKDPFDPADGGIRYLPHGNPPAIYSVGTDGVDNHGSQKASPNAGLVNPPWLTEDAVFSLVPTPRIAPPGSQPSN